MRFPIELEAQVVEAIMADIEMHAGFDPTVYGPDGAIIIYRNGLRKRLHRYLYEVLIGDIPERHALRRTCKHKRCVNPYHYEVYDPTLGMRNRVKCIHGHLYTPENTGTQPSGRRYCRACRVARNARRRKHPNGYTHTVCKRGHNISTDSAVYIFRDAKGRPHRRCRICHLAKVAERKAATRGVSTDAA